ncbi:ABC transporter ATP-binding protein [Sediminivirga luteola]|uniref:ABC transporter ATP-binding protein n=1 Tax=Sediminivirga luteola TaxID=1774748 RepID=UPI001F5AC376|nr:ABC transporter ATP-binding protein [Sediminivirga luteola]MCI2264353.1 ABC transporter ATP-binding protein [Sediminivirga luteola]
MSSAQAHLELRGLNKTYPNTESPAVDSIDLNVAEGELVALLGPSGCGKTTTLRMVAGLLDPSAGEIVVNGKDLVGTPVHKRGMGMVFQSYALFPHMTVAENVGFGLQMRKLPRKEVKDRVQEALAMVQLDHLAQRRPAALSGGQQQRVALARALVVEPTLLLLDEPLSNLDAKLREAMRREIKQIQQRLGTTTLFVTHDQDEALDMADKIAIMHNGVIAQYAPPEEIFDRPATRFVATFVGKANFIEATEVVGRGGGRYRVSSDLLGTLEVEGVEGIEAVEDAALVVRPHRLGVRRRGESSAPQIGGEIVPGGPVVPGRVVDSAYTGNVRSLVVDVPDGQQIMIDELTVRDRALAIGDEVEIAFDPDDAFLVGSR